MIRDKFDKVFSDLVRTRAKWICENCGKNFESNRGGLHCSHFFGRRATTTRYVPDNAMAHCNYCHRILGENPQLHTELTIKKLGFDRYDKLRKLWNNKEQIKKKEIKTDETYQQLKKWLREAEGEL